MMEETSPVSLSPRFGRSIAPMKKEWL